MQAKLCLVLLAIGLSQIVALPSPSLQINHPSTNFLQYLMQSRDLANGNGDHSIDCLGYYIPLINEGVTVYENNFKACLEQAALEISQINDSTKDDRDAIDASALSSCDALKVCSEKEAAEDYFECYSEAGSDSTKTMFAISANASELLAFVKEEVRLIQVNEYVCTNKTQRVYAENSAKLYEELTLCIGGAPIPSEVTSTEPTTTQSSTDSTSVDPESSTDSSPAVPESSTDSSTESESSTDSTSAASETSTDSTTTEPESSTNSEGDKEAAPEEDLKSLSSHNNKDIQNILKNLQNWFKSH
ncbi:cell wall protein IFF6 [Drosophila elegans]|uniref:cell wall protein IFF6 n=1 Tax=Drosophila elegans TaxID=30023 RepID=UPI0007E6899F|nr:cell wall protein IFF6 [Drosophila elegans]